MSPPLSKLLYLFCLTVGPSLVGSRALGQEPVFSGPQAGERLPPLRVLGIYGRYAGEEMDLIRRAEGKPLLLVIVNGANRPAARVTRALINYGETRTRDGLHPAIVWLTRDRPDAEQYLKRAVAWWEVNAPLGISLDGPEGPGSYGLNNNVNLTVLIGKEGKVTANFALVQPSVMDVPRILAEVVRLIGGKVPSEPEIELLRMPTRSLKPAAPRLGPTDARLRQLICALLAAQDDSRRLQSIVEEIERYVAADDLKRRQLGRAATMLTSMEIGMPRVKETLRRWNTENGASGPAAAKTAREGHLGVRDFFDWESVRDPQIAPDGSQVVYTRRWVNKLEDRWQSELWSVNPDGTRNRALNKGQNARWSPDGTRVAYLDDGEPSGTQIFVRWMDAEGATSQVTRVTETPGNLRWSPDSTSIAFTMLVERENTWKIEMPKPPEGADWTKAPRIIETTHYRQDRQGFLRDGFLHLFTVPADGGTPRHLTEGNWNVGARPYGLLYGVQIDWTPDGKEIVFDGLREPDADRRYRESHIYAVNAKTRSIRQITADKGTWRNPVVSPSGGKIAFTGFKWTPQTYRAEDLFVIDADGSKQRKISGDLDRDPSGLYWAADESGVFFSAYDRGSSNIYLAPIDGMVRQVTEGVQMLSLTSMVAGETAVGVRSSFHEPTDVVRMDLSGSARPTRLTRVNDDVLRDKELGSVEEIWYPSTGGAHVQGWIVKPPGFDPSKRYPLILHIHGGPHAMYNVSFNFSFQSLAANGYVVLYTNPRGSIGYGTHFGNAIDNAYPSVDYDDLMAGVDTVLLKGYVDPSRLYVTGVSGGGVLSSWTIGHTNRFAAAAVRAPVINWISFAGTTDISAWGYHRFRRHFWDDPDLWLKHSPLMYVKNVKTPTLLMTGELDLRTPMGQTEEYYQALRVLKVPTALIRFNEEYHGTGSKPSNFIRTQLYLMSWFERYRREGPTD